ncbi:hypothetical protein [Shewanella fidelis]|uniref:hypothetical protein n=1 Tax=Shewanella fidelis TaxID=173509 RepID=UPI00048E5EF2|nr:hypothetical protein [Shewanella fidelis]
MKYAIFLTLVIICAFAQASSPVVLTPNEINISGGFQGNHNYTLTAKRGSNYLDEMTEFELIINNVKMELSEKSFEGFKSPNLNNIGLVYSNGLNLRINGEKKADIPSSYSLYILFGEEVDCEPSSETSNLVQNEVEFVLLTSGKVQSKKITVACEL